jgi:endonuclease-3 related protein
MSCLSQSYPTVLSQLADRFGQPTRLVGVLPPFSSVIASALERLGESTRSQHALEFLGKAQLLDPAALSIADPIELRETLACAGLKQSAKVAAVLKRLAAWFAARFPVDKDAHEEPFWPTSLLRGELAALNGVGQATADAILLFGLGRATYPVDRGTYRVLVRHGWIDAAADYDEVRQILIHQARENPEELARLSHGLAQVGRQFCQLRGPKCEPCPLRDLLSEGGPIEPEG